MDVLQCLLAIIIRKDYSSCEWLIEFDQQVEESALSVSRSSHKRSDSPFDSEAEVSEERFVEKECHIFELNLIYLLNTRLKTL